MNLGKGVISLTASLRGNKWYKHLLLCRCRGLKRFLPVTQPYSAWTFWRMLRRYQAVIIKPMVGSGGNGVIKVWRINAWYFRVHAQNHSKILKGRAALAQYLAKKLPRGRRYLVQRFIPLARVQGSPFDFRYIVQRKRGDRRWVITGKHGKIARRGYFVTNLQKGGKIVTVNQALSRSNVPQINVRRSMVQLDRLALGAARCLTRRFPGQTIWGHDLGVDRRGRAWLIEANATPLTGGFRYLADKTMMRTIERYKAYNRRTRR
ncbi:YheC/YheD family protein [Brevibacillus migulae]|uniref:YheC/YheD family protein n=1 Tax=Brevibacillus migulae TaxID=1644114 RepID=UPI00106ED0F8|nr:YheC/YheD family protein [Brevibacillus migulae]